jgi:hypothetical protein
MQYPLRRSTLSARLDLRQLVGSFRVLAPKLTLALIWTSSAAVAAPPVAAAPAQLPAFQAGLWEYRRTVASDQHGKPQAMTMKKCTNPSDDIKQKLRQLRQKGCQFSPLMRNGSHYQSSSTCPTSTGVFEIRDVITVLSTISYRSDNEVHDATRTVRSTTVANRLGDCAPAAKASSTPPAQTSQASVR